MKDQLLTIQFNLGKLTFWHSSMMGDLNALFDMGNVYRFNNNKDSLPLSAWIQRQDVKEYIETVSQKIGREAIVRKKGKSGGTFAHLKIMIDAAMSLSPEFKDEVLDIFLIHKIHVARDESGELFKDMNDMLSIYAQSILGKPAHNGHFINIAKIIRERIMPKDLSWNAADCMQLQERTRIEEALATMIKVGVVKDWGHLKQLASIV